MKLSFDAPGALSAFRTAGALLFANSFLAFLVAKAGLPVAAAIMAIGVALIIATSFKKG